MRELLHGIADEVQVRVAESIREPTYASEVGIGADGTTTKMIDKIAEDAAIKFLDKEGSDLNVLSEECGYIDRGGRETLVMDPIDGTFNATSGIPFYSVSLAVGRQQLSNIKYGLVRDLQNGRTYWAEAGCGATMDGERIGTRPFNSKDSTFSVYMGILAHTKASDVARHARRVRTLGSAALEMCMVAAGLLDMYYMVTIGREHSLRVTDIAAGSLIVREAGGEVYDRELNKLDVELDLEPRVNVVAVGDKKALGVIG